MALLGAPTTAFAREGGGRQVHVVYEGQRLGSIAKRYNVSIEAICEANGIRRKDPIRPGQRLEIPSREELRKPEIAKKVPSSAASSEGPSTATRSLTAKSTVAPTLAPKESERAKSSGGKALGKGAEPDKAEAGSKATAKNRSIADGSKGKPKAAKELAATTPTSVMFGGPGLSHRVKAGESLSGIAVHYDTSVKTLLQVNNLRRDQVIRVGQVLTIPRAATPGTWWGKFARRPARSGEIEVFAHHAPSSRWKGKLVVNGKVQPSARAALSRLLGATGSAPPIPERLLQLLSHVSDTFGGRPIRLVSGYRTSSYVKDSRHRHSSAIDFSIPGVPNSAVRDYMLQLDNVGVGYYPNSTFVHLDVRARQAYWVDYAGPGEAPRKKPRPDYRLANNTSARSKVTARRRFRRAPAAPVVSNLTALTQPTSAQFETPPPSAALRSPGATDTLHASHAADAPAAEPASNEPKVSGASLTSTGRPLGSPDS